MINQTALSEALKAVVHPPTPHVDNSWLGLWIGLGYFLAACTAWIPIDLWLHRRGHPYITSCVRRLLATGNWGAILAVMFLGAVAALFWYHFFWEKTI